MLKMMPKTAKYYFTQAQTSRTMTVESLQQIAAQNGIKGIIYNNVADAYAAALSNAAPEDMVYVGGSMYVLAELLTHLGYDN